MTDRPDWWPTASLATLRQRAQVMAQIREFFRLRHVLEVETPVLTLSGSTELHLAQFRTEPDDTGTTYRLNTSPELAMKRLLAAGYGDMFQISRVFRANEQGHRHEAEFSLLEWYRVGFDMRALIQEVAELMQCLLQNRLTQEMRFVTYREAFVEALGVDPLTADLAELQQCYAQRRGQAPPRVGLQDMLDLLMSLEVEPRFEPAQLTFVTHYPAAQASLARLDPADSRVAERFEVFAGGLELGNGFFELADAEEQSRRMQQENQQREAAGRPLIEPDAHFLAALHHGLPECAGVALGVDRLLMLITGKPHIQQVKSFSLTNS